MVFGHINWCFIKRQLCHSVVQFLDIYDCGWFAFTWNMIKSTTYESSAMLIKVISNVIWMACMLLIARKINALVFTTSLLLFVEKLVRAEQYIALQLKYCGQYYSTNNESFNCAVEKLLLIICSIFSINNCIKIVFIQYEVSDSKWPFNCSRKLIH